MDYYFDELCLADRARKLKQLQAKISFLESENRILKEELKRIKENKDETWKSH